MRIKIELGYDLLLESPILRVDLYKTDEAYHDPISYPGECFNCCAIVNLEKNNFDVSKKLLGAVEISINQLLNYDAEIIKKLTIGNNNGNIS